MVLAFCIPSFKAIRNEMRVVEGCRWKPPNCGGFANFVTHGSRRQVETVVVSSADHDWERRLKHHARWQRTSRLFCKPTTRRDSVCWQYIGLEDWEKNGWNIQYKMSDWGKQLIITVDQSYQNLQQAIQSVLRLPFHNKSNSRQAASQVDWDVCL